MAVATERVHRGDSIVSLPVVTWRVLVRVRADHDLFTEWVPTGEHRTTTTKAGLALTEWLDEKESLEPAMRGQYRIEGPGGQAATAAYHGPDNN